MAEEANTSTAPTLSNHCRSCHGQAEGLYVFHVNKDTARVSLPICKRCAVLWIVARAGEA
jgi:hypothetical protein